MRGLEGATRCTTALKDRAQSILHALLFFSPLINKCMTPAMAGTGLARKCYRENLKLSLNGSCCAKREIMCRNDSFCVFLSVVDMRGLCFNPEENS